MRKELRSFILPVSAAVTLTALFVFMQGAGGVKPADEWIQLFNGKDLKDWKVKITGYDLGENFGDTFRVENGVMKVAYDKYGGKFAGRFGHIFYKSPFSHYILRVEYRFVGKQLPDGAGWAFRNSGIMFHSQAPETMKKNQKFPVSVEVQLLGGRATGKRPTANLCTPGTNVVMNGKLVTRHCTNSTSKTYRGDQWVTVVVEVHGSDLVKHIVEGRTVLSYTQPQLDPRDRDAKALIKNGKKLLDRGYIALQSESHPVEFRRVELKKLKH